MNDYHDAALAAKWPSATRGTALYKRDYNRAAKEWLKKRRPKLPLPSLFGKNKQFYGGTTVVGFRKGQGRWDFWYQTWGCTNIKDKMEVIRAERFYST